MQKLLDIVLILGFVAADFLLFHDFFKLGEPHTLVDYLIGVLSVVVIVRSVAALLKN